MSETRELDDLKDALRDRYAIEREIGRGGMAVVYLATDLRHPRRVAVKVIRTDIAAESISARFAQEIALVASLEHPHIVPLHDSGTVGSRPFYVMRYVEGESLRERLNREGALPVEDAVRIAAEVSDALAFAHSRSVVHRDIKPENILLASGHALVTDFGIAQAANASGIRLTETGLAVGTPAYMSPEQATASANLDGRADQYALGCVLYEMLAGVPPFTAGSAQMLLLRHATEPLPSLSTIRRVSPAMDEVVQRATAKLPADRFSSTRDFGIALYASLPAQTVEQRTGKRESEAKLRYRIAFASAVLAVLAVVFAVRSPERGVPGVEVESLASIAILPMQFSGSAVDSMLVYGLHEQLTQSLSRVPGIRIPASARTAAYAGESVDPAEVGRQLGVSTVLTGRLYVTGETMRIFPELVRVADGAVLWTTDLSGRLARGDSIVDWYAIQDQVASEVVAALLSTLDPSGARRAVRGTRTTSARALRLYAEAAKQGLGPEQNRRSLELLAEAVQSDTAFADAWALMAWRIYVAGDAGASPTEYMLRYRRAFERALRFDPEHADALAQRAWYATMYEYDWDQGIADMRAAIRLQPAASKPVAMLTLIFAMLSDHADSAVVYGERAVKLDPTAALGWYGLANAQSWRGKGTDAIRMYEQAIRADSTFWMSYFHVFQEYLAAGRAREADEALTLLKRFGGAHPESPAHIAFLHARRGDSAIVRGIRDSLLQIPKAQRPPMWAMGVVRLAAGDTAAALDELEAAIAARTAEMAAAMTVFYGGLSGHPRFDALVERVFQGRRIRISPHARAPRTNASTARRSGTRPGA